MHCAVLALNFRKRLATLKSELTFFVWLKL